jgi:hypothetical protein
MREYFEPYQKRVLENQSLFGSNTLSVQTTELDMALQTKPRDTCLSKPTQQNELTQYLGSSKFNYFYLFFPILNSIIGTIETSPRIFWRDHETEFPALASLARDVRSIPATGAGVERLFNSARDICHYRRGSLNSTTIQDLMMYVCTTRFEVEEEQLAFIREFFSKQEREVMIEEKNSLI